MLTEVKNNYKSVLKYFDFDESISSVDYKKQKLVEMAKSGEDRPPYKSKLGQALSSYTLNSSKCYCPNFDKVIRKEVPSWFVSQEEKANQVKQKLIEIAKNEKPRPSQKTKLGRDLARATAKSHESYDSNFAKIIKELRPDWFRSYKSNTNKQN